jgi:C-terminal processing protease CtpA/Prc
MSDYNAWAGPYGLHFPADPNVEYLSRIDDALWWKRLPGVETLFVQYNLVDRLASGTLGDLRTELHKPDVARVILDVRHNYGGEVPALDPILAMLDDPAVDQPDGLYVITGRNTFSAASLLVARLDRDTEAVIVGEAMGGCPTAYGDSSDVTLPYSGIVVSVAGMLEVGVSAEDTRQTIEPEVLAELTRAAWEDGRDPAREAIVTIGP